MLRIAICDDDKLDRDRLREYVDQYLYERSAQAEVRVFDHPDTLIQECENFRPQVYLLDIVSVFRPIV